VATVKVEEHLGDLNPFTGDQYLLTDVSVLLRDQEVDEAYPTGTAGTC
jgi:hypothetical protein